MQEAYRNAKSIQHNRHRGFTIVELLVVVVVIAILAAVAVVAYRGVTERSIEASMKTDLKEAGTAVELDKVKLGAYPATSESVNDNLGLKASGEASLSYQLKPYGYCVMVEHPKSKKTFRIKSSAKQIEEGDCSATVSTVAGSSAGFLDGSLSSAKFYSPSGIVVDNDGTIYVVDSENNRIRKISHNSVTTLAGNGQAIRVDGVGTAASVPTSGISQLRWDPGTHSTMRIGGQTVTTDGLVTTYNDNLYSGSSASMSPDGRVYWTIGFNSPAIRRTDYGGSGSQIYAGVSSLPLGRGHANGPLLNALFYSPSSIIIAKDGTIFLSDYNSDQTKSSIRKISGNEVSALTYVKSPGELALDPYDNLYAVIDGGVSMVSSTGQVSIVVPNNGRGYVDGSGQVAKFNNISGMAVDSKGVIYVSDTNNHKIRKIEQ